MRIFARFLLTASIAIFAFAAKAALIEVAPGESIQAAIDSAVDGDTIQLSAGTYNGNIDFAGKAVTVVGVGGGTEIVGDGTDTVVSFKSGEGINSLLDQVTVRGGMAVNGGGVSIIDSAPRVTRCSIINNRSSSKGSGVYIRGTDAEGASAALFNNLIANNRAIEEDRSEPPHGIDIIDSSPSFVNNTIINNRGNGLFVTGDSVINVTNNIIAFNGRRKPSRAGRGICFQGVSSPASSTVESNLFFRNQRGALFLDGEDFRRSSAAEAALNSETIINNIDANPRFRRRNRLNVSLRGRSAAIDAGKEGELFNDLDGSPNDIGVTGGLFPHPDFI